MIGPDVCDRCDEEIDALEEVRVVGAIPPPRPLTADRLAIWGDGAELEALRRKFYGGMRMEDEDR